jgi:hypothetical protein
MGRRVAVCASIVLVVVAGVGAWVYAGQINPPPGPVAPTMKSLGEISADIAALQGGGVKQVLRGVITFTADQTLLSATLSPTIDPAKSVVMLGNTVTDQMPPINNAAYARSSACVVSLSASSLTVAIDAISLARRVSYQVIEYK